MHIGKYKLKAQCTIAYHAHQLRKNKTQRLILPCISKDISELSFTASWRGL